MQTMKYLSIGLIFLINWSVWGQVFDSVGTRIGASFNGNVHRFKQGEAFTDLNLPWDWYFGSSWQLKLVIDVSAGALNGEDTMAFIGSAGPLLEFGNTNFPVILEGGFSPTVLSRDQFGDKNFGEKLQFTSHLGLTWNITPHISAGYRFQHMSNGGLSEHNPGLNEQMVSLSYHF
jgi:hypothetical protein